MGEFEGVYEDQSEFEDQDRIEVLFPNDIKQETCDQNWDLNEDQTGDQIEGQSDDEIEGLTEDQIEDKFEDKVIVYDYHQSIANENGGYPCRNCNQTFKYKNHAKRHEKKNCKNELQP